MNWTSDPPVEPGWYWWHNTVTGRKQCVCLNNDNRVSLIGAYTVPRIGMLQGEWWQNKIEEPCEDDN